MATMKSVTARGTRLEQLKQLAKVLASGIDACEDCRALPPADQAIPGDHPGN